MPDQHAVLSASGAHRWLNCTPSAVLEAALPDRSSPAAVEGTAAHALAEHKLRKALRLRSRKPRSKLIDDEMETHTDDYARFVMGRVAEAIAQGGDPVVMVEQRLDFSHLVPGGFGTGDCIIIDGSDLAVIDLKYGQGILVDAEDNPQLALYGLGALEMFEPLYDIETVSMTIFQPRRANHQTWQVSADELREWGEAVVRPAALLAATGEGTFRSGDWCTFCKLKATCRARAEENLKLAQAEFRSAPELTDAEIADVLTRAPDLVRWAKDVQEHAQQAAVNQGKTWPGFKLVAGRSIRKYADETAVAEAAQAAGYEDVWDRRLIGVTAMEKYLGKPLFAEVLGDLVIKPAGTPTLVPVSDRRPEIHVGDAAADFQPTN